ncbi:hypothetical protein [Photobacterium halotolerans]|uniref:hypothetical protein n=1 Tax=Photobacterium halotolerans TaxID=265726 RepID=UPI001372F5DE|nr:hypothetical protein [Photobacterium halotolerans]NAW85772.1 hypothetical protein [Photobacterium halotolerans]
MNQDYLTQLGFKFGKNGAHSARSMMIEEIQHLLLSRDKTATKDDYENDIINFNILHKPTEKSRQLTYRHLVDLYALDRNVLLFDVLRNWWDLKEEAQPILALQLAIARDPLLRSSAAVIRQLEPGEYLARETIEAFLAKDDPGRFSAASLKSFSQNINGTWTQAGFLSGKAKKFKEIPKVCFVNVAYALFLAHCQGLSGQRLFDSFWCQMLCQEMDTLYDLAYMASLRGLIKYKHAGDVIEISFPDLELPEV